MNCGGEGKWQGGGGINFPLLILLINSSLAVVRECKILLKTNAQFAVMRYMHFIS